MGLLIKLNAGVVGAITVVVVAVVVVVDGGGGCTVVAAEAFTFSPRLSASTPWFAWLLLLLVRLRIMSLALSGRKRDSSLCCLE